MLLEAACEAFARDGFDGASTASIAAAADCSEAVLFRHFPSKRALLAEAFQERSRTLRVRTAALAESEPDPARRLHTLAEEVIFGPEGQGTIRLLVQALGAAGDQEVRDALLASFQGVRSLLVATVREGQERGVMRADVAPESLAWLWQGLMVAAAIRASVSDDATAQTARDAVDALGVLSAIRPER